MEYKYRLRNAALSTGWHHDTLNTMRFVLYTTASNATAIVIATFLAAAIAMGGELSFLPANNVAARGGNMIGGTMRQ